MTFSWQEQGGQTFSTDVDQGFKNGQTIVKHGQTVVEQQKNSRNHHTQSKNVKVWSKVVQRVFFFVREFWKVFRVFFWGGVVGFSFFLFFFCFVGCGSIFVFFWGGDVGRIFSFFLYIFFFVFVFVAF